MKELRGKIIKWADDKGILSKATPLTQCSKVIEEAHELFQADRKNDMPEVIDAVGDVYVTLVILAELLDMDWELEIEEWCKGFGDHTNVSYDVNGLDCTTEVLGASLTLYRGLWYEVQEDEFGMIGTMVSALDAYCRLSELSLKDCVQTAYDVISKRTGKMVDGLFVKDK